MRNLVLIGVCLLVHLASAMAARAGDVAELEILGFSKDGGVFAFEEYGVAAASGLLYAKRSYITPADDTFLKGTPIRVRLEDETASLDTARQQARQKGEAVVVQAELTANRGIT